jgi:hypothetical protein
MSVLSTLTSTSERKTATSSKAAYDREWEDSFHFGETEKVFRRCRKKKARKQK